MKTLVLFLIFICLICLTHLAIYAQEDKDAAGANIGEGMEIRRVKGFSLLVPKDARVWQEGGVLRVEGAAEYSASRFIGIEKRLAEVDMTLTNLQNQIEELKKMINATKEAE